MTAPLPPSSRQIEALPKLMLRRDESEATGVADNLAELFLEESTSNTSHATHSACTTRSPIVLGLILGHLPVFAAAWASQYAFELSLRDNKPVGIVRVRGGEIRLDVIGVGVREHEPAGKASLAIAISKAHAMGCQWLVHVDESAEQELIAAACGQMPVLDGLTLVSGVDKAAVVAAYGRLKKIAELRPKKMSLAIVSTSKEPAEAVGARLARAAEDFLKQAVEIESVQGKIGSHPGITLFSGVSTEPMRAIVSLIRQAMIGSVPRTQSPSPFAAAPKNEQASHDCESSHASIPVEPAVCVAPDSAPAWAGPRFRSRRPSGAPLAEDWREFSVLAADGVTGSVTPEPSLRPGESLVSFFPGYAPVGVACPIAPSIELAMGDDGSLHLLAWHLEGSIEALLIAHAWATSHRALLNLALKTFTPRSTIVQHLLTDRAAEARTLLDCGARVHAVATATSGERVRIDLN